IDNGYHRRLDVTPLRSQLGESLPPEAPPSCRRVCFFKRRNSLRAFTLKGEFLKMFRDRLRVHSLFLISLSKVPMRVRPVRIHFQRMAERFHSLIVATSQEQNLSDVYVHHDVERVKLVGASNFGDGFVRPTQVY